MLPLIISQEQASFVSRVPWKNSELVLTWCSFTMLAQGMDVKFPIIGHPWRRKENRLKETDLLQQIVEHEEYHCRWL